MPQLDEISYAAHTCQPDRARGSQEVNPLVKKPVGEGGASFL